MNIKKQQGVGLVEILVALVLLAISVLGFAALQLRAIDASFEANKQVLATTIARDLAERMRANPQATRAGKYKVKAVEVPKTDVSMAADKPEKIALQDLQNAALEAKNNGMNLAVDQCPTGNNRQCIYVAWDQTNLAGDQGIAACIKDGAYVSGSHCLFLEAY
ncbi:type IV pilus modification protein PilV [Acinetobacter sp. ANC 3929]|uniref:type IV pilus modification protein PilV n=1 Tax=unclassified Acinetobacter TaxID=196816 RepID=UPI0002CEBBF0|nr:MULTISPECIES: type IV pilus modification protein PilV [unclassified Acinetobacter]ENW83561.1 type IV pilus modification protein PilV [Acinetobacter sp. ANC 3929]MCH7350761.1 type IV pilus modification protein PilV [Acinetobacter sp. NIPH 2023]MCH7354785.1 type IV pilus modification protein PilV [Acinetobacter sp. NIPH 1958]MCH7358445.1 type IV pilus modification protein PilV [Acinetobacter sp. NIPH 2024]